MPKKNSVFPLREQTMTGFTVMREVLMSLRRLRRGKSDSVLPNRAAQAGCKHDTPPMKRQIPSIPP